MSVRTLVRLAVALCAVPLLVLHAPAAEAAGDHLEFSLDGRNWTAAPPSSLFDDVVMVPGASTTTTLHLRSTADTPGMLSLAVDDVRASDARSAQHFGLVAETTAGTRLDRLRFADLEGTCVGTPQRILPGQRVAVTLTIDLDARTVGTDAQNGRVDFSLHLAFVEAAARSGGGPVQDDCAVAPDHEVPALPPVDPTTDAESAAPAAHGPEAAAPATAGRGAAVRAPAGAAGTAGDPAADAQHGPLAVTGSELRTIGLIVGGLFAAGGLLLAVRRRGDRS